MNYKIVSTETEAYTPLTLRKTLSVKDIRNIREAEWVSAKAHESSDNIPAFLQRIKEQIDQGLVLREEIDLLLRFLPDRCFHYEHSLPELTALIKQDNVRVWISSNTALVFMGNLNYKNVTTFPMQGAFANYKFASLDTISAFLNAIPISVSKSAVPVKTASDLKIVAKTVNELFAWAVSVENSAAVEALCRHPIAADTINISTAEVFYNWRNGINRTSFSSQLQSLRKRAILFGHYATLSFIARNKDMKSKLAVFRKDSFLALTDTLPNRTLQRLAFRQLYGPRLRIDIILTMPDPRHYNKNPEEHPLIRPALYNLAALSRLAETSHSYRKIIADFIQAYPISTLFGPFIHGHMPVNKSGIIAMVKLLSTCAIQMKDSGKTGEDEHGGRVTQVLDLDATEQYLANVANKIDRLRLKQNASPRAIRVLEELCIVVDPIKRMIRKKLSHAERKSSVAEKALIALFGAEALLDGFDLQELKSHQSLLGKMDLNEEKGSRIFQLKTKRGQVHPSGSDMTYVTNSIFTAATTLNAPLLTSIVNLGPIQAFIDVQNILRVLRDITNQPPSTAQNECLRILFQNSSWLQTLVRIETHRRAQALLIAVHTCLCNADRSLEPLVLIKRHLPEAEFLNMMLNMANLMPSIPKNVNMQQFSAAAELLSPEQRIIMRRNIQTTT